MQLIITLLVFMSLLLFFRALQKPKEAKVDLQGRLKHVISYGETTDMRKRELTSPISERMARSVLSTFSALGTKILPSEILQSLEKKVQLSGGVGGFAAREYLGMKLVFVLGLPMVVYFLYGSALEGKTISIMMLTAILGWRFPEIRLDRKIRSRADLMEKTFPDSLDLLTVSVEAGLGFDGALLKVAEKSQGPVAEEFRRVLHEIKMGKTRREALRDFGNRCGVDDIKSFVSAIVQTDQLGLNIANTLKIQAELMRRKRRQRIEEKAMKVPVKMLIPMVLFIFPTIFIVLLGPAAIQILESFIGM